jgi:50S ribosomal protein L16 3-hydroxylase
MDKHLLGGLSAAEFLRDYWQKQPLLVRNAIPGFSGLLDPAALQALACEDEVQARLIRETRTGWALDHGPFKPSDFKPKARLPWTLLVQELNHHRASASDLLQQFDFIPHARLDDLMVSYAVAGGGVGAHFDSYDVFLLQGSGQRRWQIGAQTDLTLVDGAPLKILQNFVPEHEWVLNPGDMLYLPPRYAHNGVAVDACTTYSIGFRAPSVQEIATQFLVYLQDKLDLPDMYQDADLALQTHPGEIGDAMLNQVADMVARISWQRADIADFLGRYLTEPKPHLFFDPPEPPLALSAFKRGAQKHGVALAPQSLLLWQADTFYLNGEALAAMPDPMALKHLADRRRLTGAQITAALLGALYPLYLDGYIVLGRIDG